MQTITLLEVQKADAIYQPLYQQYRERLAYFSYKSNRSPELAEIPAMKSYLSALDEIGRPIAELGDNLYAFQHIDELTQTLSNDETFVGYCKQLFDGTHPLFKFSMKLKAANIDDIALISNVAQKYHDSLIRLSSEFLKNSPHDCWRVAMLIADLQCVITKCQAIVAALNTPSYSTVSWDLIRELFEKVDECNARGDVLRLQLEQGLCL